MKISIFGAGYVGLVTAACFAENGHEVICVDSDSAKIDSLNSGQCPIYEPELETLVEKNVRSQRLLFIKDTAQAVMSSDLIFVAVGTPVNEDGSADVLHVFNVIEKIISCSKKTTTAEKIIVIKSTVPVGTYNQIQKILSTTSGFKLCSNPEFLREGSAVHDCLNPSRVILGLEDFSAQKKLIELYKPFVKHVDDIVIMDPASSEMTKYAANAMLATRISLMNEFSRLCEKTNADIKMVEQGIGSDPRIGPAFLKAGLGYGGSCFPKDLKALLHIGRQNGETLDIIAAVENVNLQQKFLFLQKLQKHFVSLKGLRIAIWGTSFKPGTDDIRESPAIFLIQELLKLGASVRIFDPQSAYKTKDYFSNENVQVSQDIYDCLIDASAVVLATEWDAFLSPDLNKMKKNMKTPVVFDGRNLYVAHNFKELGFTYYGVGLT